MTYVRRTLRLFPWALALIGLAIPLVGSGFALWLPITGWLIALVALWLASRQFESTRQQRLGGAVLLLPVLFLAGFMGGWWLIPADIAWIAVEIADPSPATF